MLPPRKPACRPPSSRSRWIARAAALLVAALALGAGPAARAVPDAPGPDAAVGPNISASAAILVDLVTGTVLWEKNSNQRRAMASTTKIMTGTLIIETARMTDMVMISEHATRTPYASLHATAGEQLSMQDLLYAIMLRSANDGCVAAAEHIAGSEAAFVGVMNQKAQQLGLRDTHFVTTNGLHDPQHYTTASDLARLARYAVRYPLFNQVVATPQYRITTRTHNTHDTLVKNHNRMLEAFPGADGIKTGYVRASGRCLVASATRLEGNYPWRLVAVSLNSKDTYADCAMLLDYGFKNFQPVFFARQGQQVGRALVGGGLFSRVPVTVGGDVFAVVPRGTPVETRFEVRYARRLEAPVRSEQVVGSLYGYLNGQLVTKGDLVSDRSVGRAWTAAMSDWGGWTLLALMLVALGPRYARSVTEGARRRRRRFAAGSGGDDRGGTGPGEWAARTGTWN